jgi:hypothetical protein
MEVAGLRDPHVHATVDGRVRLARAEEPCQRVEHVKEDARGRRQDDMA